MIDFYRVVRGIEIDGDTRILRGAGIPGTSPDTISAGVGSLYLDNTSGTAYSKKLAGTGADKWASAGTGQSLISEQVTASAFPSAQGADSIAIGNGAVTLSTAPNAIALGTQTQATIPSTFTYSNGRFASIGDSQAVKGIMRATTVNGIQQEAYLPNTQRFVLRDNSTLTFTITCTAHRTDQGDGHAGYQMTGVIYRGNGVNTVAFQGYPTKTVFAESDSNWDINITADQTYGCLRVFVVGQAGKTIRWAINIDALEVTN